MGNEQPLFSEKQPDKTCLVYGRVRKGVDDRSRSVREHCEDLWQDYEKHADKHFLSEFPRQFHQRWFEMYLTVSLIRAGIHVECRKPGPDVLVRVDDRRVWIEAVCAGMGKPGEPDSVPEVETGVISKPPIREYVIRIRNSLDEKAKKFSKYIDDGIVESGDLAVIAINVGGILGLGPDMDEYIKKSVYGIGDPVVSFDRGSGTMGGISWGNRISISKTPKKGSLKLGAPIGVQCFTDESMEHIAAVLGSGINAFTRWQELGQDFILYPNLTAVSEWTKGLVPLGREWTFEETVDGWTGKLR